MDITTSIELIELNNFRKSKISSINRECDDLKKNIINNYVFYTLKLNIGSLINVSYRILSWSYDNKSLIFKCSDKGFNVVYISEKNIRA